MNRAKGIAEATTSSADDIPIACSLSATDLGGREVEWRALLDTPLVKAERIPSGVRLTVQPGGTAELQRLIDLERTCCAWMEFEFDSQRRSPSRRQPRESRCSSRCSRSRRHWTQPRGLLASRPRRSSEALSSDDAPDCLDHTERPSSREKAIDAGEQATKSERQDEHPAASLQPYMTIMKLRARTP
jgi:hypothetical protein